MPTLHVAMAIAASLLVVPYGVGQFHPDQPRTASIKRLTDLAKTYKGEVDEVFKKIRKFAPAADRPALRRVRFAYSPDIEPYVFFVNPNETTIHLSVGGLTAVDLSTKANSFNRYVFPERSGWWIDYLYFNRDFQRTRPGLWLEPDDLLGLELDDFSPKIQEQILHTWRQRRLDMLAFVVGHESAHVLLKHSGLKGSTEDDAAFRARRIEEEIAADLWSLRVVAAIGVDPYSVMQCLFTHFVIYGRDTKATDYITHPGDLERMSQISVVYREYSTREYKEFIESAPAFIGLFQNKLDESPYAYFDKRAASVSRVGLHYRSLAIPTERLNRRIRQ
jgi:hypothetical protein